jgi:hypothetical protein
MTGPSTAPDVLQTPSSTAGVSASLRRCCRVVSLVAPHVLANAKWHPKMPLKGNAAARHSLGEAPTVSTPVMGVVSNGS